MPWFHSAHGCVVVGSNGCASDAWFDHHDGTGRLQDGLNWAVGWMRLVYLIMLMGM